MPLTTIQADGWRGTYTSPPAEFDPVASPETLSVTRSGFDASGSPTSPVDSVTVMKRVREPYPNQATLTAEDVSLSDYIYAGDTISGVTNNSTRAYPKPICLWLDHDNQRATGGTYTAKLAVAHAYARNGRPVAAVKFIATDGTTTVEQTVSTMSSTTYSASGLTVPHFEAALDLSTLTDNVMITIDAVIYPWVGAAYQASVDGATYPSINFTTMRVLNDVSYGTAYAYVDPVLGDNGTGVVSQTPATAQASPYATIAAAATAIQTFNNTTFGRNNASGGIIRLEAGTHVHSSYSSVAVADIPLEIEAANPANKATTIYADAGASVFNGCPGKLKISNVTLRRGAANYAFLDSAAGAGSSNMMAFSNVDFDDNGGGSFWGAWMYRPGRVWAIECSASAAGMAAQFSSANKTINQIGCLNFSHNLGSTVYNIAGSREENGLFSISAGGNREVRAGIFKCWNFLTFSGNSPIILINEAIGSSGCAIAGNILEKTVSQTSSALQINADTTVTPSENVVLQGNTIVGERVNFLYNDSGNIAKSGYMFGNAFDQWNVKSDVFATNGAYVGNWPVIYHVGHSYNSYLRGSNRDDAFDVGSWLGEVAGIGSQTGTDALPLAPDWADDASSSGTSLGGGDYTPGAATELQTIPAGRTAYPIDLNGRAIPDDGTAFAGASQQEASGTTIDRQGAVDAISTIAVGATLTRNRGAAVAAASQAQAVAGRRLDRAAAVTALSSLIATDTRTITRSASVATQSTVNGNAAKTGTRSASVAAQSSVSASASVIGFTERTAAVSSQSTVSASAKRTVRRSVAITATSSVAGSPAGSVDRTALVSASSLATASAKRTVRRSVAITATSSVAGSPAGSVDRTALVSASSLATATAHITRHRAVSITATSAAQMVAERVVSRSVQITAGSSLTVISSRTLTRTATVAANSNVSAITEGAANVALHRATAAWSEPTALVAWAEHRSTATWRQ